MENAPAPSNLPQRLRRSAVFRGNPQTEPWLRLAIGLAAFGYSATAIHRTVFLPHQAAAQNPEFVAAALCVLAFAFFRRSPRTASLVTLAVVWVEPLISLALSAALAASMLLVFPVVVAISGLVFGRGSALLAAVASMVAIPAVFSWSLWRQHASFALPAADVSTLIVVEFVLAGIGLLVWAMIRSLDNALATSERLRHQYTDLFEHSPNGLLTLDEATNILEANEPAARLLGLDRAALCGRPFAAALVDAGTTTSVILSEATADRPVEIVLSRPGLGDRSLELVRRVESANTSRTILALRDVTEQRRAAMRIKESEERFRFLIESVPNIAVQGYDRDRRVIFWNSASTELYGFTADEAIGRRLEELIIPPAMHAEVIQAIDRWVNAGVQIPTGELTLQRKGGAPLRVLSSHVMQCNSRGEPEMYCLDFDLTERDYAARILRENEERYRLLFNSSNDAVMVYTLTPDGTPDAFIEVNAVACSLLEYTRAELLALRPAALDPISAAATARSRMERLRSAGRLLEEVELVTRSGRSILAEINAQVFEFQHRPTVLAVARDVSARKSLETQLRQAQKMEVVGRLAGGVAHDFNNILTAMLLNLEVMRNGNGGEYPHPHLEDIEAMAKRAAKLTQQLLMFARQQALQPSRIELNAALAHLLRMLRRLLGEHIVIKVETTTPQLWLEADPSLLDQIVMNLCLNARDAMPAGGTLVLQTSLAEFATELPSEHPEARPGRFACLAITDTGCGMPPDVIQHLFEPFFTTKNIGQGTGLGLASVHGIVHQHRGWIEVESTVGRGSCFRIFLPCGEPREKPGSASPFESLRSRHGETVLLVEDEDVVRRVARAMLIMLGYQVFAAVDGPEAQKIWTEKSDAIDLLLTDMVMPGGLNGIQLGRALRQTKPGLKIVVMSGYSMEIARQEAQLDAGVRFLPKPFDSNSLASTIRHCLDQA